MTPLPVIVPAGAGRSQNVIGDNQFVRLRTADTGGALMLFEQNNPPGAMVPPHVHLREDELFFIVDGEVDFTVEDEVVRGVGSGSVAYLPRGVRHGFQTAAPTRSVVVLGPPTSEAMFEELAGLPPGPPDMVRVLEICDRHDVPFAGQPRFESAQASALGAVVPANGGKALDVLGITTTVKAAGGREAGFSVFVLTGPPGTGVPPHTHDREDETFYILEGEVEVTVGGATHRLTPGALAFLPRQQAHSFTIAGSQEARILLITTPGGIEDMFAALASLPPGPPDPATVAAVCAEHGVNLL